MLGRGGVPNWDARAGDHARFFELPLREAREAFERIYFEQLLGREQSNMSKVAERPASSARTSTAKLKQLNIRFSRRVEEPAAKTAPGAATVVPLTPRTDKGTAALVIGAIGVVYGDIGTSPLYMLRTAFTGEHRARARHRQRLRRAVGGVLGAGDVVTLKYIITLHHARRQQRRGRHPRAHRAGRRAASSGDESRRWWLVGFGIFGAAMFYGDGMITPAISVLSGGRGPRDRDAGAHPYIVPVPTLVIIVAALRHPEARHRERRHVLRAGDGDLLRGDRRLGAIEIVQQPGILAALNPRTPFASSFTPLAAFLALAPSCSPVTGTEALYADMGHFGASPIRRAWIVFVHAGAGAQLLRAGRALIARIRSAIRNPFFLLAPAWALIPLVSSSRPAPR